MIRRQYSPDRYNGLAHRAEQGERVGLPLDLANDYFAVYHAMVGQLGELTREQATPIVRFYGYCKLAIDSMRTGSPYGPSVQNLRVIANISQLLLDLGDAIQRTAGSATIRQATSNRLDES